MSAYCRIYLPSHLCTHCPEYVTCPDLAGLISEKSVSNCELQNEFVASVGSWWRHYVFGSSV